MTPPHVEPGCAATGHPHLLAVGDLHVRHPENADVVAGLAPRHPDDWLLVAGDVAETTDVVLATLASLADRFAQVVWTPGNHELWTHPHDPDQRRGVERYEHLVERCRELGVLTPEDEYARWSAPEGDLLVAPLFLLYDYSFRDPGTSAAQALSAARSARQYLSDQFLLQPDPHPDRPAWCHDRVATTEARLAALRAAEPTAGLVTVSHYPLAEEPTRAVASHHLRLWCGTRLTADWHRRFAVDVAVYGHLHIPRTTRVDGVRFEEVSLGYPRERQRWGVTTYEPRVVACGR
ncbi:metallophosphoesterase [Nocardioides zeae]|uniref:Metallophosphoesterase n=1 Tax=Nocardioides imazamoxiresistens TaxID=3231893 RepID=A0ABU3PT15_9ACTN|nr:metallophosphoesterase [Nocardioides zeae]MDT9592372.1 metallophosphoesterase [Nocardioides zeae]